MIKNESVENIQSKITAIISRSSVQPKKSYSEYKDYLRHDFWYSCAYCNISEIEAIGIGFQIDHFNPTLGKADGKDDYENLMWSCDRCNRSKSDIWPPLEAQKKGHRFIKADVDDPREHVEISGTKLIAISDPGKFSEKILRLNRLELRRIREIRKKFYDTSEEILLGLRALSSMSLDKIKPYKRLEFLKQRNFLLAQYEQINRAIDNLSLREWNKSPLLDEDPNAKQHTKNRREYLSQLQTIYPDPWSKRQRKIRSDSK